MIHINLMTSTIWNKYTFIKEMKPNSIIKTYKAKLENLIIKEINPRDKNNYHEIYGRLQKLKQKLDIYEIRIEGNKFYIVLENNEEILSKIDKLILSDELDIQKEAIIQGHGLPISKEEIDELFKKDKCMCKISFETEDNKKGKGSGFFCKLNNFPIKYALFTNNHVLNEFNLEKGKKINFEYLAKSTIIFDTNFYIKEKQIEITEKRRVFTNKDLDYTCIELFESDGISDYFQIDPNLFKYNNKYLLNNDIFLLQYPIGKPLSFSCGKILSIEGNDLRHSSSSLEGSSGSPIIKRGSNNNYVIGLHSGSVKNRFNIATSFISILNDIKDQINIIICVYKSKINDKEISLLHDYKCKTFYNNPELKKLNLELKNHDKNIFENEIDMYIDGKKVKFDYKYKIKEAKEIQVKFKFKKIMTNMSCMFYGCSALKSIDFSLFNTNNINDISGMFCGCSSLESINFSSINLTNIKDMSYLFYGCSSLKSIDLSSLNTTNVTNMSFMFSLCSHLQAIDMLSLDTTNVTNMTFMFSQCYSLKSINLSSINIKNVINMSYMFSQCSSLKAIDLSSFNSNKVTDISGMFNECSSLQSINLSSFNSTKVKTMFHIFYKCSSLKLIDLSSFITDNIDNMDGIFLGCSSLKKENIKINNKDKNKKLLLQIK